MLNFKKITLETLDFEQVRKAAAEGKLFIVTMKMDDEEKEFYKDIKRYLVPCKPFLAPDCTMVNVSDRLSRMMNDHIHTFRTHMTVASRRPQFICKLMGILIAEGIFMAKPSDLAALIRFPGLSVDSIRRYISEGNKHGIR